MGAIQQAIASYPGVAPPPSANMAAWYRKGVGITSVAGAVSAWADQSGNGHDLLQATSAKQPALQGDGSILFDGSNDCLRAVFTLSQPCTVYVKFKFFAWVLQSDIFDGSSVDGGTVTLYPSANSLTAYAGALSSPDSNLGLGTYGVLAVVWNGVSSVLQIDANTAGTGNFGANNMGGFTLGAAGDGVQRFTNMQVKEAILYSAAHDATNRAAVRTYLASI